MAELCAACDVVVSVCPPHAAEEVAAIEAPLLLHYAGLDERINAGSDPEIVGAVINWL